MRVSYLTYDHTRTHFSTKKDASKKEDAQQQHFAFSKREQRERERERGERERVEAAHADTRRGARAWDSYDPEKP
jgi:hypothetical protein